jgi:hypothetical protein
MRTEQTQAAPEQGNTFDAAALIAEAELKANFKKLDATTVQYLASWWNANYMPAGHKRLGRVLVRLAKNAGK